MFGGEVGRHIPVALGATTVLMTRWDRDTAAELIQRYRVTGIVGISGIDTRSITRHIRSAGSMRGGIFSGDAAALSAEEQHEIVQAAPEIADAPGGGLMNTAQFLAMPLALPLMLSLLGIAVAGGMFVVPLYAFLTTFVDKSQTSRTIAANNIVNSGAMVAGSVIAIGLSALGVPMVQQLLLVFC